MTDSFADAATRHRHDARLLAESARYQNAGHLIGFAAECFVKAQLEQAEVDIGHKLKRHFPDLAKQIGRHASDRLAKAVWDVVSDHNFLSGWSAERRYDACVDATSAHREYDAWERNVDDLYRAIQGVR